MLLKTIKALTRSRGFESRALLLYFRKTSPDLGLQSIVSFRRFTADRSQTQLNAAMSRWSRDVQRVDPEAFSQVAT